jgi:hypothetical protein
MQQAKRPRTKDGIIIGKWLDCGCCGQGFQVWEDYEDQDQDRGYGICMSCQIDSDFDNIEHYINMFRMLEKALIEKESWKNLAHFQNCETWERISIVNRLMDKGYFTWSIG